MTCFNPSCSVTGSEIRLKIYSGCREAYYSSAECQKVHWGAYKHLCKAVPRRKLDV